MKALMLIVAITAVALAMGYYVIGAVVPSGRYPAELDAALIRNRCHVRLVQPEWVSSNDGVLMNWVVAETRARVAAIGIFWFAAVSFIARYEMDGNENGDAK
jgi:hypothetical protein